MVLTLMENRPHEKNRLKNAKERTQ
jgi:hypothetical protein